MINAFKKYSPDTVKYVSVSIDDGKRDLDFLGLLLNLGKNVKI